MYTLVRYPIVLLAVSLLLISCDAFNTKVPASEIKKATQWSSKDQFPSFPDCQGTTGQELVDCFSTVISDNIEAYLSSQAMEASAPVDSKIEVVLNVDKAGSISLTEFKDPDNISSLILDFEALINEAVGTLPQALPAVKTNVGTAVAVQLQLPITIVAQPEE